MGRFGMGASVRRSEDERFLCGNSRFLDDLSIAGAAHAAFLRSPVAHAEIRGIETGAAAAAPGVRAVFTGAALEADGVGELPCVADQWIELRRKDGSPAVYPGRPLLAQARVRHVGEAVALVVADSEADALNALEAVAVEYQALPLVVDTAAAAAPGAAQIWPQAPGNVSFHWEQGDKAATDAAFAAAAHVVALDLVNNRVVVNPIETRGAIGLYDPADGRYTLYTNGQHVYDTRRLSALVLGIDEADLRVLCHDVGGGFGIKYISYPEQPLMLWAARKIGRPVKWMSGRAEAFLCDAHARDHVSHAELALDPDGRFLALRVTTVVNLGAYASSHGPVCASILCTQMLMGGYTMPAFHAEVRGVFSNTGCVDAYRGAGQPEAMYLLERIVDKAARELGLAADELRRRNFIAEQRMPYTTPSAITYDSGDFVRNLDDCLALADWTGFAERRQRSQADGRLRGIGLASYVEAAAADRLESTDVAFNANGTVTVHIGTMSSGQGHETTYAQLLHEELGIPFERIVVVEGDTDRLPQGGGSGGSRSAQMAGTVIHVTAAKIRDKARTIAAHMLEAAESDIEFRAGAFVIVGTDRALGIMDIAAAARDPANLPDGMAPGLDERGQATLPAATFPNGSHICEVEVDPETGAVAILRYSVVSDFGRVINPMLLEGQVHGGVAQGIGQALLERTVYDADGQLLSGSFMDYCLPRADDLPSFGFGYNEVPCTTNPLGVKGAGEAGTIGSLGAAINAIVDALAPLGVRHIDMPATPEQVWRAIRAAREIQD